MDGFNASNLRIVIAAALTTNVTLARRPANVLLGTGTGGLLGDSVVLAGYSPVTDLIAGGTARTT